MRPGDLALFDSSIGEGRTLPLFPEELALLVEFFGGRAEANGDSTRFVLHGCEARVTVRCTGGAYVSAMGVLDVGIREVGLDSGLHTIAAGTPLSIELVHPAVRRFRWECVAVATGTDTRGARRVAVRLEPPPALPRHG